MTDTKMRSILVVEDNPDDYEATIRALKKAELYNRVSWCRSGREALDFLRHAGKYAEEGNERPGLILLDLNMPGIDGRKTLQLIKSDMVLKQIPVVVLSTSADERDIEICYRMGANSYVQKPVSFDGLTEAMKRLKRYCLEIGILAQEEAL